MKSCVFAKGRVNQQGLCSQKVLGLNVQYQSTKFKPKTWLSPFVNTCPGETSPHDLTIQSFACF